jgi:pimeloyl-ACP methyl ester carboxylesterase
MMNLLSEDIIFLADAFGMKQFNLAGHDFGALVSWNLADKYPGRIKKMVILNVPHPKVIDKYLRKSYLKMI